MKFAIVLFLMIGVQFAISYGGDAFPNASIQTSGWFINTTLLFPYPMVYNQTNETDVSINSSDPFNISFSIQLNNRDGETQILNLSSPELNCTNVSIFTNEGGYNITTPLDDWRCSQSNLPAGYTTLQFYATDLFSDISTPEILTGTYQADVAQPPSTPLAYAPDNMMGSNNSSTYGAGYAFGAYPDDTPATELLALQKLQANQTSENESGMAILPVQVSPSAPEAPPSAPSPPPPVVQPSVVIPMPTPTLPAPSPPTPFLPVPNSSTAPAQVDFFPIPWWVFTLALLGLLSWSLLGLFYFYCLRAPDVPKEKPPV